MSACCRVCRQPTSLLCLYRCHGAWSQAQMETCTLLWMMSLRWSKMSLPTVNSLPCMDAVSCQHLSLQAWVCFKDHQAKLSCQSHQRLLLGLPTSVSRMAWGCEGLQKMDCSCCHACRMLISHWRAPVAMSWWECWGQQVGLQIPAVGQAALAPCLA